MLLFGLLVRAGSSAPFICDEPCSNSGLLCIGGPIVAEVGGVVSMESPALGDSDEALEEDRIGRFLCLPSDVGGPEYGLRGAGFKGAFIVDIINRKEDTHMKKVPRS